MQDDQYYADLHVRIVKGAEFIESLPSGDKRLPAAHKKYDALVEEYRRHIRVAIHGHDYLDPEAQPAEADPNRAGMVPGQVKMNF